MELLRNMLSISRIMRFLILVLACVAIWKVWDYIGLSRFNKREYVQPLPVHGNIQSDGKHQGSKSVPPPLLDELEVQVSDQLRVQVLYEPLCPDSRHFIRYQLVPAMAKLHKYLDMQLVPYGKATTMEENGEITFRCQHGPTECLANKIHSCVVNHVPDQVQQLKIVDCMIADNYKPEAIGQKCVVKVLGSGSWGPIHQCYNSRKGNQILKHMGSITHSLDPPITFIPTITVDGSQDDEKHILQNLTKVLCKRFRGEVPAACAHKKPS